MKTELPPQQKQSTSTHAFSLVEVVLAVGIMALGVVTILGLLPHGLEMSRKTANEMAEVRIVEHIVGELQNADWASFNNGIEQVRYFDDQGLELPDLSTSESKFMLSYVAQVNVPQLDVYLPTNNTPQLSAHLRRVTVKLIAAPLADFNFNNPSPGVPVKVYSQLISRMGTNIQQ